MNTESTAAVLSIALMAAYADGAQGDAERQSLRDLAESLGQGQPELARALQGVLLRRTTLDQGWAALGDAGERELAYEMAVCVCDADGARTPSEQAFLDQLRARLDAPAEVTARFEREESALAAEALRPLPVSAAVGAAAVASAGAAAAAAPAGPTVAATPADAAAVDRSILRHAILCGALELLPQSWASMAIIPLQIKLVYGVGQAYGYSLDQGHIKEFLAAAGVGLTAQTLEQYGRKLIGGLLGRKLGGTGARVGSAATGVAMSFATTYALGQLAQRYYAGGRTMSTTVLRETFQGLLGPARDLQTRYLPQIREQAATLDAGRVMDLVRQGVR